MAADCKLGGFNGTWGSGAAIDRKRLLLEEEGVKFDKATGKVLPDSMHNFMTPASITSRSKRKREAGVDRAPE